jgi:predicted dehydrogenase
MMGWFHAARYVQLPNATLVAIADVTPERLEAKEAIQGNMPGAAQAFDFSAVARYAEAADLIVEADVDVVDVCLPTYLHARYAIQALEAGRHVLCEKPMALTVADADRMIAAAQQADRRLMIAQCIRFWPEYLFLKQCVQEQPFGKLRSLNMFRMGGRPIWSWENWFLDPERSGGMVLDLHIHDVDYVNDLLGIPDDVQATARRSTVSKASTATDAYDIIHASYHYANGPQVHLHGGWSMAQIPFNAGFDAWFERGFLRYDGRNTPALQVFDNLTEVAPRPVAYKPSAYPSTDAYLNEIAYFLECVETDTPPTACSPDSARDSLALVQREVDSVRGREGDKGRGLSFRTM